MNIPTRSNKALDRKRRDVTIFWYETCPRCGGSSGTQSIQFTEIRQSVPVEELPPARVPGLGPGSGGLTLANGLWVIVSTSWLLLRPPHRLPHKGETTFTLHLLKFISSRKQSYVSDTTARTESQFERIVYIEPCTKRCRMLGS